MCYLGDKILIIGCSGSGKSTFSKKLQKQLNIPLFHLDTIWWNSDRSHISRLEFDNKLNEIMSNDNWIIDGDYSRTYENRIKNCDTVIFLDYDEKVCMEGITERVGKNRTDIPWTENTLDPELVKLVKEYHDINRPMLYELFKKYSEKTIIIFNTRDEANKWVSSLIKRNLEKTN